MRGQPLLVVDETEQRLVSGGVGQQIEHRQPNKESVGDGPSVIPNAMESADRCGAGNSSS